MNDYLRFEKSDVALDLGCGNGKFAYWNRGKVTTMLAADLAPWFADRASAELPLLRADLRALPIRDEIVDKVFSIDVLEHLTLADIASVLNEAHRILRPGGRAVVMVYHRSFLYYYVFNGFFRGVLGVDFLNPISRSIRSCSSTPCGSAGPLRTRSRSLRGGPATALMRLNVHLTTSWGGQRDVRARDPLCRG